MLPTSGVLVRGQNQFSRVSRERSSRMLGEILLIPKLLMIQVAIRSWNFPCVFLFEIVQITGQRNWICPDIRETITSGLRSSRADTRDFCDAGKLPPHKPFSPIECPSLSPCP